MSSPRYLIALSLAFLCPCFGKEVFYLSNGFHLEADSHTQDGQTLVLHMGQGTVQLGADEVLRVEHVPDPPAPPPAPAACANNKLPEELVFDAAVAQGLPPEFVKSVARIESGLREDAVSPKGARGLMQLMPGTAADLGVEPRRANENAAGGARYLRELLLAYHGDAALALAAYNAGPGAVSKFRGVPPYAETRRYIVRVLREYAREQRWRMAAPIASCTAPVGQ